MPQDWITTIGLILATLSAVVACAAALLRLRRDSPASRRTEHSALWTTTLIAVALFAYRAFTQHDTWEPLQSHLDGTLLLMALLGLLVIYLQWVGRLRGVEVFALPVLALLGAWGVCASWWSFHPFAMRDVWAGVHVTSVYLGLTAAALAGVTGLMYLFVQRQLRRRDDPAARIQLLGRMASLESIENWLIRWSVLAFAMLSLAMAAGIVEAASGPSAMGENWWASPKVMVAAAAWLIFALLMHVRLAPRFRGGKAAALGILGFVLLLVVLALALTSAGCGGYHGEVRVGSDPTAVESDDDLAPEPIR